MDQPISSKIAVILREDLANWQKLNVTAFLSSGIAHAHIDSVGLPYEDADANRYLAMFGQPVMVFEANTAEMRHSFERAKGRDVTMSIFPEEIFSTGNDVDNRAAVATIPYERLRLAGFAFRAERKIADKISKGLRLHS